MCKRKTLDIFLQLLENETDKVNSKYIKPGIKKHSSKLNMQLNKES